MSHDHHSRDKNSKQLSDHQPDPRQRIAAKQQLQTRSDQLPPQARAPRPVALGTDDASAATFGPIPADLAQAAFRPDLPLPANVQRSQAGSATSSTATGPSANVASTSTAAAVGNDTSASGAGNAAQEASAEDSQAADSAGIDPPIGGINKSGFIDHSDGSNIRTGPAEAGGRALTAQPLPPATRVFVSGQHPQAPSWWYVSAYLPSLMVRGYVQDFRVNTELPEPSAKLYQVQPGDTAEGLAVREFAAAVEPGRDLRYYENVLLAVNRTHGRAGIHGTFQAPNVLGGGSDNIQLEAGRRIWLVSPTYARALVGTVPDGSLTGGGYARAKASLAHIDDLLASVTESPAHFDAVAGEYAEAIRDHLPEIIAITAGFIAAESASAFLAATPTGVGQLAAVVIQLGLAALGAAFAVQAAMGALEHGKQWLTLAWTANGDPAKLAQASRAFLGMLVEIAMAALAMLGARANAGKGLHVAESVKITPPKLGWSPSMVTPDGAVLAGGPVFTPGSVTSAGAVDIGVGVTSGLGPAGTFAAMSASGDGAKSQSEGSKSVEQTPRTDSQGREVASANAAGTQELTYGKNAMIKLRKHAQQIREIARRHGIDVPKKPGRPETFSAMDDFLNIVISNGTTKTGRYMSIENALWSKLGDAIVIRRMNGEFLTFLDYAKGGAARGWDLLH